MVVALLSLEAELTLALLELDLRRFSGLGWWQLPHRPHFLQGNVIVSNLGVRRQQYFARETNCLYLPIP